MTPTWNCATREAMDRHTVEKIGLLGALAVAVVWLSKRCEEKDATILLLQQTYAAMVVELAK